MDDNHLYNILTKIQDDVGEIKVTMARNTVSLEEHIKRTNILEEKVEIVENHVNFVQRLARLLPWTLGIAAMGLSILAYLKLI